MAKASNQHDTPAMKQFRRFKEQHPDCVLFFRMGDFYEMFYDDAKLANRVLGVSLTQRTKGIPMAGVPHHAVEGYLRRMIQAGYRVAVCDQVEEASQAKGIVKRDVTRVVTPGTLTDESLLDEGKDNPLAAVMFHEQGASAAWVELSTGAFSLATFATDDIGDELARIAPKELLYVETADGEVPPRIQTLIKAISSVATARPTWQYRQAEAVEVLCKQFKVAALGGFGLSEDDVALGPAGAIIHYLNETQKTGTPGIAHLRPPKRFDRSEHLIIDQVSLRSLEVEQTMRTGQTEGSLLGVLQDSVTAMGKRMLRHWLCYPLTSRDAIEARQRVVAAFIDDTPFLESLRETLRDVQDVQRMISRIAVGRAAPRDLVGLATSSKQASTITEMIADRPAMTDIFERFSQFAPPLTELADTIAKACVDAPPAHLRDGGVIRDGFDTQLDEYRSLQRDSNDWLAQYQKQLIEQTGITSLKIGFNRVFGYYIELTGNNRDKAPDEWSRKQTLKNAERFITPQLKEYEGKVLSAQSRAIAREQTLFTQLCAKVENHLEFLHSFGQTAAQLDVLACFARQAIRFRYVRPTLVDEPAMHIVAGRHPVLDQLLGDQFVPNDVGLGYGVSGMGYGEDVDDETRHPIPDTPYPTLALITGPNMAGKSTYIRQTALIVLLAHTGSYVPAESAVIGLCDRIFTRIGASDELHAGQSTFMVEMTETANICNHATPASLIILDEIGRGTSTLDGLSLAWAIGEYLAKLRCRCLFATHYHEITALAEQYPNATNLNVTVRDWQDQIVFLHQIVPGATNRSYGIHVAKIAGLPPQVVQRADELMAQLEVSHSGPQPSLATADHPADPQLSLFTEYTNHPVIDKIRDLDIDTLSPMDAFDLLRQLKRETENK